MKRFLFAFASIFLLTGFHPVSDGKFFEYGVWQVQYVTLHKDVLLERDEIEVRGFLALLPVDDNETIYTLYHDKDFRNKGLGTIFGLYIFTEIPDWTVKRADYFGEKNIRIKGHLEEMECPGNFGEGVSCLVLRNISQLVLEDDYQEIFEPDSETIYLHHGYQIYYKIENQEDFLVLIKKLIKRVSFLIENNDLEGLSQLFHPDSRKQALEELKTPGSYIRWFLFNDISDLPDYYHRKPPKSFGGRMFEDGKAEKVFYQGNPAESVDGFQMLKYCKRFDDGKSYWKEIPEFIDGSFELDVVCFNFEFIDGKVYLPRYLVTEYSP